MKNPVALWTRFIRFNTVGAVGIGVQLGILVLLKSGLGMNYIWATALAVEAAVLHNFCWHVKWTWRDRAQRASAGDLLSFLWKFHVGNGIVSLAVNLILMRLLVGAFGLNYLAANLMAIAAGGVANFYVGDRMVFYQRRSGA